MNEAIKQLGLIGYPLSHSFSPKYFANKFEKENITGFSYNLYPITTPFHLQLLLNFHPDIEGLNVTNPYKESVMPYLSAIDPIAAEIGAVNTIVFKDGKMIGHNTDAPGFEYALLSYFEETGKKPQGALVLGSGGASKAVKYSLRQLDISHKTVSRNPTDDQIGYDQIDKKTIDDFPLIINTTPVGVSPQADQSPAIPYDLLSADNMLFDLIYNPEKTLFLAQGETRGCSIQNGLKMLEAQAEYSWTLWNMAIAKG